MLDSRSIDGPDGVFSSRERRSIGQLVKSALGLGCRFLSRSEADGIERNREVACGMERAEGCTRRHCVAPLEGELRDDGRIFCCPFGTQWYILPILEEGPRDSYLLVGPFFEEKPVREAFLAEHPELAGRREEYPVLPAARRGSLALIRDWVTQRVENLRLRNELERKQELLISILDSTRILHTTPDPQELLAYLTDISAFLTGASSAFILLLDEGREYLSVVTARGVTEDFDRARQLRVGEGVSGRAAERGESLNVGDTRADSRVPAVDRRAGSELAVPIRGKDRVIGVLVVDSEKTAAFGSFDEQLLRSFAFQVSTVLDAGQLAREREGKLAQLQVLHDVAAASGESLDVDVIIPKVLEQSLDVFQASGVVLLLVDGTEKTLFVKLEGQSEVRRVEHTRPDAGIVGWVLEHRKPLLVHRDTPGTFERFRDYMASDEHATMCVPLTVGGDLCGALLVDSADPERRYAQGDLDLLGTLAGHIAHAVQNARLFARSRRQVAELKLINQLGKTLNSTLDLEQVLGRIIDDISALIGAQRGSLMLWDDKDQVLKASVSKGLSDRFPAEVRFRLGEGIAGIVAETQRPLLVENTRRDARYQERVPDEPPLTLLSSPVVSRDRVVGVLNFERGLEMGRPFTEDDLRLLTTLSGHAGIAIENARLYQNLLSSYFETIRSLANALEAKDAYTHGHSRRVAIDSVRIAQRIGLPSKRIEMIRHGALLHDIGKIGIRDSILLKPGALTDEELAIIRRHPVLGANMIQSIEFLRDVTEIIKHHHERYDGKGFPHGLVGEGIPLGARIVCVADAFDAMVTTRPYRQGMPYRVAIAELARNRGTQFDAAVVDAFVAVLHDLHPSLASADDAFNPRMEITGEAGCDWVQESAAAAGETGSG